MRWNEAWKSDTLVEWGTLLSSERGVTCFLTCSVNAASFSGTLYLHEKKKDDLEKDQSGEEVKW